MIKDSLEQNNLEKLKKNNLCLESKNHSNNKNNHNSGIDISNMNFKT